MSNEGPSQVRPSLPTTASAYDFARLLSRSLTSLNLERQPRNDDLQVEDNDGLSDANTNADLSRRDRTVKRWTMQREFMADLILSLDILVYIQICAVYYADCSTIRFLSRVLPQWVLLTPKPPQLATPPTKGPGTPMILLTNIFILFHHLLSSPPAGGESVRGYLHGGLLMDFVGELGPVSKFRLLLLDMWILALQLVLLAIVTKEKRLKASLTKRSRRRSDLRSPRSQPRLTFEDLDAEERGVRRSQDGFRELSDETFNLGEGPVLTHPCDAFYSGQQVIAHVSASDLYGDMKSWKRGDG